MAPLDKTVTVDKARMIADAIDRARRDVIQEKARCQNATALMYYEGKRTALAEIQAFVEKVAAL